MVECAVGEGEERLPPTPSRCSAAPQNPPRLERHLPRASLSQPRPKRAVFTDGIPCCRVLVRRQGVPPSTAVPAQLHEPPVSPPLPGGDEPLSPRQNDIYQGLRRRMRAWLDRVGPGVRYADIILLAPDLFHLMCRLVADGRVSPLQKAKLAATIAYFVTPIGLVPELLTGPLGYVDDVALAAYVLNGMLNSDEAHIVREHWAGDKDVLNVVRGVLEVVDSAISNGLWSRIKSVRLPRRRR